MAYGESDPPGSQSTQLAEVLVGRLRMMILILIGILAVVPSQPRLATG